MRKMIVLWLCALAVVGCGEKAPDRPAGAAIHPVFSYSNYDGEFGMEDGNLIVYEAVFDDSRSGGKPVFIGYIRKRLATEIVIKGRVVNAGTTVYLDDAHPSFVEIASLEDMERLMAEKLFAFPRDKNAVRFDCAGNEFSLRYDNIDPARQSTELVVVTGQESASVVSIPAFYIWHRVYGRYLAVAFWSAGGSGHTIGIEIYNLEDALPAAR